MRGPSLSLAPSCALHPDYRSRLGSGAGVNGQRPDAPCRTDVWSATMGPRRGVCCWWRRRVRRDGLDGGVRQGHQHDVADERAVLVVDARSVWHRLSRHGCAPSAWPHRRYSAPGSPNDKRPRVSVRTGRGVASMLMSPSVAPLPRRGNEARGRPCGCRWDSLTRRGEPGDAAGCGRAKRGPRPRR